MAREKDDLDLFIEDMEQHDARPREKLPCVCGPRGNTGSLPCPKHTKPLTREKILELLTRFPGTPYVPHGPLGGCGGGTYS